MKICHYCGNRIEDENATECPICHRPVLEDFTIPKHPENLPLWRNLCIACALIALAFLFVCIRELVVVGFTRECISDFVFFVLSAAISGMFAFFYRRSV